MFATDSHTTFHWPYPFYASWSAKYSAVIKKILKVLKSLSESSIQSNKSKPATRGFINKLILEIWYRILPDFNRVNSKLQASDLDLAVASNLYQALVLDLRNKNDEYVSIFENSVVLFTKKQICTHKDVRTRTTTANTENPERQKDERLNTLFMPIIEDLVANLNRVAAVYIDLSEKLSFLPHLNQTKFRPACHKIV